MHLVYLKTSHSTHTFFQLYKLMTTKSHACDMHSTLRLLLYIWVHSSMNSLSFLLLRPGLCFIIYLIKHKVYCVYKYPTGLVGKDCKQERVCSRLSCSGFVMQIYSTIKGDLEVFDDVFTVYMYSKRKNRLVFRTK